jgi:hypothetical protein
VLVRRVHQALRDEAGRNGLRRQLRHRKTRGGWVGRDAGREFDCLGLYPERVRGCQSASDAKYPADARRAHQAPLQLAVQRKAEIRADRVAVAAHLADAVQERAARRSALPLVRQEQKRALTDELASAPDASPQERLDSLSANLQAALASEQQVPLLVLSRAPQE